MTDLYRYRAAGTGLSECLAGAFGGRRLIGFAQSPGRLLWLVWDGQRCDPSGLDQVYEARLFCEQGELRWLRDPESDGAGRAAWVSEQASAPTGFEPIAPALSDLDFVDGRIISYGEDFPGAEVPKTIGAYALREYIGPAPGTAGEDGNRVVVEQRILGIVPREETGATR